VNVARKQRADKSLSHDLQKLEERLFQLKVKYDKYFLGLERFEPMKDRDGLRMTIREMMRTHIPNSAQRYRFQTLRARWNSLDQYINRNIVMIERGTHPKMKFRANLAERRRASQAEQRKASQNIRERREQGNREDIALRKIYNRYISAREQCGQSTNMSFDSVRDVLKKQVRTIKGRYQCNTVKFRVTVEGGKAKLKALPIQQPPGK
jgi:hypothetical protein